MDFNLKTMLAFKILSPKMLNISFDFLMPISVSAARSLYIKHVKTGIFELCLKTITEHVSGCFVAVVCIN